MCFTSPEKVLAAKDGFKDKTNLEMAKKVAMDITEHIAVGVLYENIEKKDYYSRLENRSNFSTQLIDEVKEYNINEFLVKFK